MNNSQIAADCYPAATAGGMAPEEISGRVLSEDVGQAPISAPCNTAGIWVRSAPIANVLGVSKKTVHARALAENWPMRMEGNRHEYQPPDEIAVRLVKDTSDRPADAIRVRFPDLSHGARARESVLMREQAVQSVQILAAGMEQNNRTTLQQARANVVADFAQKRLSDGSYFQISIRSLQRWEADYREFGLDGLVDQKKGRVGKKAMAAALTPETIMKGRALALDHGIKGETNIARAHRQLAADPTLDAAERTILHGAHASKSYVAPSIREALKTDPFTAGLLQIGPKHARLHSRWTPCDHSQVKAGQIITADDMTANCYVWAEWPNEIGWIVLRPQILAVLDVGSLAWTNLRAILRARGQYTKDDVWGVTGDFFDGFGMPERVLFEGGIWRSNVVAGHKTGLDDESRFGGLRSLGIQLLHSREPRSKPIEMMFNQLQFAADTVKGYSGREEKRDRPEYLAKQLDLCAKGKVHPREYFLSLAEYTEHITRIQAELNNERQDGEILRGRTPADKWSEDEPKLAQFPEAAKWLYRSAYSIETIGRNGITITQRSGRYRESFHYDNPELLTPLQGRRVAVYWNDHNPETDAVLLSLQGGKPHTYLGVAQTVTRPGRFSGSKEELSAEARRKGAALRYAVSQSRSLAPFLQRQPANLVRVEARIANIGQQISQAAARAETVETDRRNTAREINRTEVTREDLAAALASDEDSEQTPALSADEISDLFNPEPEP
jgi:hypothetical protein